MINILILTTILGFLFFYNRQEKNQTIIMLYLIMFSLHLKYAQKREHNTNVTRYDEKLQSIASMFNGDKIITKNLEVTGEAHFPGATIKGGNFTRNTIHYNNDITTGGNIVTGKNVSGNVIHGNELVTNGTVTGRSVVTSGGNINIPEKNHLFLEEILAQVYHTQNQIWLRIGEVMVIIYFCLISMDLPYILPTEGNLRGLVDGWRILMG